MHLHKSIPERPARQFTQGWMAMMSWTGKDSEGSMISLPQKVHEQGAELSSTRINVGLVNAEELLSPHEIHSHRIFLIHNVDELN
jgi:hypothetical protein